MRGLIALSPWRCAWFCAAILLSVLEGAWAAERTYYVQAEEFEWDYVPSGFNLVHCLPLEYDAMAAPFVSVCTESCMFPFFFIRDISPPPSLFYKTRSSLFFIS